MSRRLVVGGALVGVLSLTGASCAADPDAAPGADPGAAVPGTAAPVPGASGRDGRTVTIRDPRGDVAVPPGQSAAPTSSIDLHRVAVTTARVEGRRGYRVSIKIEDLRVHPRDSDTSRFIQTFVVGFDDNTPSGTAITFGLDNVNRAYFLADDSIHFCTSAVLSFAAATDVVRAFFPSSCIDEVPVDTVWVMASIQTRAHPRTALASDETRYARLR